MSASRLTTTFLKHGEVKRMEEDLVWKEKIRWCSLVGLVYEAYSGNTKQYPETLVEV